VAASSGCVLCFCIFYEFFSGTFIYSTGPALAMLSPDLALVGTYMRMSFAFGCIRLARGESGCWRVILNSAGWIGLAMFCGAANMLAAAFVSWARMYKTGWKSVSKLR
jgi:hypothetical protein